MKKIVDFAAELADRLARIERPVYVQTKRTMGGMRGNIPRIGIMPGNYAETDKGVLVGGVSDGAPAAKAGLKEGDVIVEIAASRSRT